MRAAEGAQLAEQLLSAQVDTVERLVAEARPLEPDRAARARTALADSLARMMDGAPPPIPTGSRRNWRFSPSRRRGRGTRPPHRPCRGRPRALADDGPKGRKLDFLVQEFNREANTLCAKAQFAALTKRRA
jgi:uncharacterized protein YicC (UPF0701 family)